MDAVGCGWVRQAYCGNQQDAGHSLPTAPGIQSIHLYICARGFVKMHSKIMIFSIHFHSCKVCGIMKSKNANQKPSLKKY